MFLVKCFLSIIKYVMHANFLTQFFTASNIVFNMSDVNTTLSELSLESSFFVELKAYLLSHNNRSFTFLKIFSYPIKAKSRYSLILLKLYFISCKIILFYKIQLFTVWRCTRVPNLYIPQKNGRKRNEIFFFRRSFKFQNEVFI